MNCICVKYTSYRCSTARRQMLLTLLVLLFFFPGSKVKADAKTDLSNVSRDVQNPTRQGQRKLESNTVFAATGSSDIDEVPLTKSFTDIQVVDVDRVVVSKFWVGGIDPASHFEVSFFYQSRSIYSSKGYLVQMDLFRNFGQDSRLVILPHGDCPLKDVGVFLNTEHMFVVTSSRRDQSRSSFIPMGLPSPQHLTLFAIQKNIDQDQFPEKPAFFLQEVGSTDTIDSLCDKNSIRQAMKELVKRLAYR